jgi:3',5'-cyclic AMP phosphodiesterase CpdA
LCEKGAPAELTGIRDLLKQANRETKVVIGNHDWTSQTDRKAYEELYPDSINYSFQHMGWQFIGLDTSYGVEWQNTAIQKPTFDWLDQNLPKLDKRRPTILFTHFPLGEGVRYRPTNAEDLLNRFKEFNLKAVFNGHFHGATEKSRGDYLITTNKCCARQRNNHDGTREKGFLACKAKDGKIIRQFVQVA